MEEIVHMKLEGVMVEMIEKFDPNIFKKFTITKNRKKVLYVQPTKALYGTVQEYLLLWEKL